MQRAFDSQMLKWSPSWVLGRPQQRHYVRNSHVRRNRSAPISRTLTPVCPIFPQIRHVHTARLRQMITRHSTFLFPSSRCCRRMRVCQSQGSRVSRTGSRTRIVGTRLGSTQRDGGRGSDRGEGQCRRVDFQQRHGRLRQKEKEKKSRAKSRIRLSRHRFSHLDRGKV